jgi:hypothetical protein
MRQDLRLHERGDLPLVAGLDRLVLADAREHMVGDVPDERVGRPRLREGDPLGERERSAEYCKQLFHRCAP